MKSFAAPAKSFGDLEPMDVGRLVAAAADIALILDADGIVLDIALGTGVFEKSDCEDWIGKEWLDVAVKDSRAKAELLLREAESGATLHWRQVTHHSSSLGDLSLSCAAVKLATTHTKTAGRLVVFCRDLRAIASLQQSVIDAQQESLRDNWKLRDAQSRYLQLFQNVSDAVMIVDASTQRILEVNPAAVQLIGDGSRKLVGSSFSNRFDVRDTSVVQSMLVAMRANGRADEISVQLADGGGEVTVSGSMFRQENGVLLVMQLKRVRPAAAAPERGDPSSVLLKVIQSAPDCIVVTDVNGQIISANDAFIELVQLANLEQVRGETLGRWVGRTGVELSVLISTLRQRGSLKLFPTSLRCEHGLVTDVEISATLVREAEESYLGFTIRDVSRRQSSDTRGTRELPTSAGQLAELVGRVPMKDIVGETTDLIEQLCIEAALELTRDNRAAAAEMLGMSRQSLYVKLRRYGLGELAVEAEKQ